PQDIQVVEREQHADDGDRDAEDQLPGNPEACAGFHLTYSTLSRMREPRRKTSFHTMATPTAMTNSGHDSWNRSTCVWFNSSSTPMNSIQPPSRRPSSRGNESRIAPMAMRTHGQNACQPNSTRMPVRSSSRPTPSAMTSRPTTNPPVL